MSHSNIQSLSFLVYKLGETLAWRICVEKMKWYTDMWSLFPSLPGKKGNCSGCNRHNQEKVFLTWEQINPSLFFIRWEAQCRRGGYQWIRAHSMVPRICGSCAISPPTHEGSRHIKGKNKAWILFLLYTSPTLADRTWKLKGKERPEWRPFIIRYSNHFPVFLKTYSVSSSPNCIHYIYYRENSLIWNAQDPNVLVSWMFYFTGRHQISHTRNSSFQCWDMATGFLIKVLIKYNLIFIQGLLRYSSILYWLQEIIRNIHCLRLEG